MKYFKRIGAGPWLFITYWLLFMIGGRSRLLKDPGTFWHTRVGDLILERGFFRTDPFTFTHTGGHWIPHQWLGEVGMAAAYSIAGLVTFLLLSASMLAGLFTWLSLRLMRTGLHVSVAFVITCVAIAATATHLHVRPILFTIFVIAITAGLLSDYEDRRISVHRLYWLVPLFLIWTNIHGGMLGGLGSLGLVVAGWIGWRILSWPSPIHSMHAAYLLILLVILCTATMIFTPYGIDIPQTWFRIMQGSRIAEYIEEHQPLDPQQATTWGALLLVGLYLFMLIGTFHRRPHVTWLLPLFWMLQMFLRIRHAPLFAMTATIAIASMWPQTIWAKRLLKRPDLYDPQKVPTQTTWGWLLPAILISVTLTLQVARIPAPVIGSGWAQPDPTVWPTALLPLLMEHEPSGSESAKLFNALPLGGWVSFQTPGYQTFIDDRIELYSDDFLDDYILSSTSDPSSAMARWQKQYGRFQFALVKPDTYFNNYFSTHTDWIAVGQCDAACFYRRRSE